MNGEIAIASFKKFSLREQVSVVSLFCNQDDVRLGLVLSCVFFNLKAPPSFLNLENLHYLNDVQYFIYSRLLVIVD